MPLALVKSLSSSTRAFAGSHAAQHNVRDLPSACADDAAPRVSASVPTAHARDSFVLVILIVAPPIWAGHCRPLLNSRVGRDFKALFARRNLKRLVVHGILSMSTEFCRYSLGLKVPT